MALSSILLPLLGLSTAVLALPSHSDELSLSRRTCGKVQKYYGQTDVDWQKYDTDKWLNDWVNGHPKTIAKNPAGFAGAWGQWAIGNPDWSCRDDGSSSDCDFDPCSSHVLGSKGKDLRHAYYVTEGINRLHTYFTGMSEAFETAAIGAALTKDSWATTFYKDKDDKSPGPLREMLGGVTAAMGIASAGAGVFGPWWGAAAGAVNAVVGGAIMASTATIGLHKDDTFEKSADLGALLAKIVVDSMKSFVAANNALMHGDNYNNMGDIRSYLQGGLFVDFGGIDKNAVTNTVNNLLIAQAINQLWRSQKIFIMGGTPCGDETLGTGPANAMLCVDGKAWFLYYWQENDVVSLTSHRWGWTNGPPGADQLGQGDYAGITIQDVIKSSLGSYIAAGYSYNYEFGASRVTDAIQKGWARPSDQGPGWEGVFTIPVCDIGWAMNQDFQDKQYILQPWGHDYRPHWCALVCSGNAQQTQDFINAANMLHFQSPKHMCKHDPGYD